MSDDVINLALSSVTEATLQQYNCPLKKWHRFCEGKNLNPLHKNVKEVQNFLALEFKNGAAYGTINSYRSALSLIFGSEIAVEFGIKRLCKGAGNIRPPKPKYDCTWNPKMVLEFLSTWPENEELSLQQLSYKLAILLMLITGHRIQTLSVIRTDNIGIQGSEIVIKITDRIKTSKPGRKQPLLVIPFYSEKKICVAQTLTDYMAATKNLRETDKLFISFRRPHKAVTAQTLSKWIKNILKDSGVDTSVFSAYSVRHASNSAAKRSGVDIDTIRSTAGWTKESETFARFYDLRVREDQNSFARAILNL